MTSTAQRTVLLLVLGVIIVGVMLVIFLCTTELGAGPPRDAAVRSAEASGSAVTAASSSLIREEIERTPSGYIVAIDGVSGRRLEHFHVHCSGQFTYSEPLGMVQMASLPSGDSITVGAVGYHDETLSSETIMALQRNVIPLQPRHCDIDVIASESDYRVDDYVLWSWLTEKSVPLLRPCAPNEIRSGMHVYAIHGDDASDVVQVRSESQISLKLHRGRASSLHIDFSASAMQATNEDALSSVRLHFPSIANSRWLRVAAIDIDLPKIDTRICAVPGRFRIDHSRTMASCPGWRDEGRVHIGRLGGSEMPRRWGVSAGEVILPAVKVADEEGRPLPGVRLRTYFDVRNRGEWRESSYAGLEPPQTNELGLANWTGGWLIDEIRNQGVKVEITRPGYSSVTVTDPAERWGSSVAQVVITRCPERIIRVLGVEGEPFGFETLRVLSECNEVLADTRTDSEGNIRMPLAVGTPFCLVSRIGKARGIIRDGTTEVALLGARKAVIEVPTPSGADLVLVSSNGEVVEQSGRSEGVLTFSTLSTSENYTVVPRDALDQYRLCRFAWPPDIVSGLTTPRLSSRPSWLDVPATRAYITAVELPAESIIVIPWYGGSSVPLPGGHIPGKRLPVNADYSVDLTGLHGQPPQLVAILREPESGSDWVIGSSNDLAVIDCTVKDVVLAPSGGWIGGTATFHGPQGLRWGVLCATDGIQLTENPKRIARIPSLVERITWRKLGGASKSFSLPPGGGVWHISNDDVTRLR